MKGFGIEIKNELLDPKHVEKMGIAVWLYMWLIDHITSTTDKGIGKVLGGKPIRFDEVKKDLGISQDTYTRWIDRLLEYPYIEVTRAPYGIIFRVLKAHKRFGNRYRRSAETVSAEVRNLLRRSAEPNIRQYIDNTEKTAAADAAGKTENEIIDLFKEVNPSHEQLFKNKTQRAAVRRLLDKYGPDKMTSMVRALPKVVVLKGAPQITTPLQLEQKLGQLVIFYKQQSSGGQKMSFQN